MRRQDREVSERAKIDEVIESCDCIRLGLNAEDGAYIVPLSFGYAPEEPAKFYFHSATEGRKVSMIGSGTKAGFEMDSAHRLGEAELGCKHTYFFKSVIGTGFVRPVEDLDEKKRALTLIMAHYRKDRAFSFTDEQARTVLLDGRSNDGQGAHLRRKTMNDFEQQYLPEAYRPLSPWAYFGLSILYAVPFVGWIFLIAHAVASRNINKRNYARSFFCIYILAAILILLLSFAGLRLDLSQFAVPM